jgi:Aspartyl protease
LRVCGPLIPCFWSVPSLLADRLQKEGRPVPGTVEGQLLVDTGAQRTCISQEAARDLGLISLRLQESYGAHGLQKAEIFRARLTLVITDQRGGELRYDHEAEAQGIPDLEKNIAPYNVRHAGKPARLVGLLGRDILQHATLTYNGTGGWFEINFDLTSLMKASQTGQPAVNP